MEKINFIRPECLAEYLHKFHISKLRDRLHKCTMDMSTRGQGQESCMHHTERKILNFPTCTCMMSTAIQKRN